MYASLPIPLARRFRQAVSHGPLAKIILDRTSGLTTVAQSGPAKVSTQVMFTKIPPAAAGGLFIPKLPRTRKILRNPTGGSRWIVHSQATEDTKDSPQSHRRQPVDCSFPSYRGHERFSAIPPAAAGGSFSPNLCFPLLDAG